jgi:hypothetical protein
VQGSCGFDTGCRGARLLVWLILNDRVRPSLIAGVLHTAHVACLTGIDVAADRTENAVVECQDDFDCLNLSPKSVRQSAEWSSYFLPMLQVRRRTPPCAVTHCLHAQWIARVDVVHLCRPT